MVTPGSVQAGRKETSFGLLQEDFERKSYDRCQEVRETTNSFDQEQRGLGELAEPNSSDAEATESYVP